MTRSPNVFPVLVTLLLAGAALTLPGSVGAPDGGATRSANYVAGLTTITCPDIDPVCGLEDTLKEVVPGNLHCQPLAEEVCKRLYQPHLANIATVCDTSGGIASHVTGLPVHNDVHGIGGVVFCAVPTSWESAVVTITDGANLAPSGWVTCVDSAGVEFRQHRIDFGRTVRHTAHTQIFGSVLIHPGAAAGAGCDVRANTIDVGVFLDPGTARLGTITLTA